jgi:hypothetical protein
MSLYYIMLNYKATAVQIFMMYIIVLYYITLYINMIQLYIDTMQLFIISYYIINRRPRRSGAADGRGPLPPLVGIGHGALLRRRLPIRARGPPPRKAPGASQYIIQCRMTWCIAKYNAV